MWRPQEALVILTGRVMHNRVPSARSARSRRGTAHPHAVWAAGETLPTRTPGVRRNKWLLPRRLCVLCRPSAHGRWAGGRWGLRASERGVRLGGGSPRASVASERAGRPLRSGFLIGHRERACARAVVDQRLARARSIQHAGAPGRLAGRVRRAWRNALARLRHHSAKLAPPS